MFSRKKKSPSLKPPVHEQNKAVTKKAGTSIPSIISSDLRIVGNITGNGVVDIDGLIEGNIRCQTATIRKHGHIKGDVIADSVFVYGRIQGLIKARSVHFFKGCRAEGVINHESITIEDGAFVDGRFKRTDKVELEDSPGLSGADSGQDAILDVHGLFLSSDSDSDADSDTDADTKESSSSSRSPKKGKKSETMLDNLRLISDSNS